MKDIIKKINLDRPAKYEIKVPGLLNDLWFDSIDSESIDVSNQDDSPPCTTITVMLDQAALQGVLRRLYSIGLPLISVICIEV